jgi:PAS domain S-box-containing protein
VRSRRAGPALAAAGHRRQLRQWWLDRPVRAKGRIVIAIPLIALIGTTSASLVLQFKQHEARSVALATTNLTGTANQVLADAVNGETGIRGYVATSDSTFLAPYTLALTRISADRTALRNAAATEGDRRQQRAVNVTTGQVLAELAQLRAAVFGGAFTGGLRQELLNGKTTMNLLRQQVASLTAGPAALIAPQLNKINRLEATIDVLDVAALGLGLLAGLFGVALFTSGISRRITVAAANADRLGAGQPLEPAARSDDELGHLASALVHADELLTGPDAQQVKARLALLAAVVDSSNDAILSKDAEGLITSWNPAAERIYGYPASEVIGQHIAIILQENQRSEKLKILSAFTREQRGRNGHGSELVDVVHRRKDGSTVPISTMLSAIRDDEGVLIGTSSISRDVTEQQRAAAELRRRMEDLERANSNLETFSYSVSHDLRAPLRALSGFSTALLEEYGDSLDEAGRGYAQRIDAAAERMAQLIDDLLHLSRLWRTDIQGVTQVDLSAEVTAIATELQHQAPGRHGRFTIQDGVKAPADPILIRTVLQNLLENAWKFTSNRDEAQIEFGTTPAHCTGPAHDSGPAHDTGPAEDTGTCYYVRDNGAGFDPAYTAKLFKPFQRLHTMREFPGTGVGLASVRQIIERHGGRTWAESTVNHGATFYFTLDTEEAGNGSTSLS